MTAPRNDREPGAESTAGPSEVSVIWQNLHDGLRAFIATRVADEAEVDDILQEVFLRVHRRLDGLRDPERIVAWLFQIARHAIIDYYRTPRRNREVPVGLADALDVPFEWPNRSPETGHVQEDLAACLRPMLERLSAEYREAITLVELDGLTREEAAKRMGLSVSGMKSRVQRGRQQLRQMLDECCRIERDRRGRVADYEVRDAGCDPCRDNRPPQSPSCE
jgi:RNA polymerase sigma-70 factor (ECF subfamily)